jgi:hypothetical protein
MAGKSEIERQMNNKQYISTYIAGNTLHLLNSQDPLNQRFSVNNQFP